MERNFEICGGARLRRHREKDNDFFPRVLSPSPQVALIAQACGCHAERVDELDEVPRAVQRALDVVRNERRQALLNVICKSPV